VKILLKTELLYLYLRFLGILSSSVCMHPPNHTRSHLEMVDMSTKARVFRRFTLSPSLGF
jgi:hypothetical protein